MIKIRDADPKAIMVGDAPAKAIYRGDRLVWISDNLPVGYTRCKYLRSDGAQLIDIGQYADFESRAVVTATRDSAANNCGWAFGYRGKDNGPNFTASVSVGANSGSSARFSNKSNDNKNPEVTIGQFVTLDLSKNGFFIDGVFMKAFYDADYFTTPSTIRLFGNAMYKLIGKISMFKLFNGERLLVYFVPALDSDGRPCMFDIVSKSPFYNIGTGEFTYEI